ncbi:MAG TPA: hypothetical protein VFQ22_08465, partial [Longimicrobiales bacterium]|nr:hypothetical protein [Longimicrobiales bacterium]
SADSTEAALDGCRARGRLVARDGFYLLPGRERLGELRQARAERAREIWPRALAFAALLSRLPFVRMVAVTGSLAWDNVSDHADADFMIVTEPGRVWLVRWLAAALRRSLMSTGLKLCANYVLSERTLALSDRDVYVACELVGMRVVSGVETYRRMRRVNGWARAYFPNAEEPRVAPARDASGPGGTALAAAVAEIAALAEPVLRTRVGNWLKRSEMAYRMRKYDRTIPVDERQDDRFGPDTFKCHLPQYRQRALVAFEARLAALGLPAAAPPRR